ncbi:hypothetical protein [Roseimaritima ulvae]|uniref:Zinc finger/thioredoxin putative domain-containing protein n=1 Tax=Roseimaritima ulvae TaxID=980254 RepID=A0A5B9QTK4_9BACT|nr:hypothetical protein [Roseimaritima ulvae]QEG40735.1 hypothetical protein UC8_27520 [Roseimaritima ulvae]
MSDIQRTCPQCQALLEVPGDAVGKQAQCPACQHVFTIPELPAAESSQTSLTAETSEPAADPPTPDSPQPNSPQPESPQPGGSQFSPAGDEDVRPGPPVVPPPPPRFPTSDSNPYAPSGQADSSPPRPRLAPVQITTAEPAEYINATWSLFRSAWKPLVAAGTVAFAINFGSSLLGTLLTIAAQESGEPVFGILNGVLRTLLGLASLFITLGMMRMSVDLARGQTIRFSQVFQTGFGVFGLSLLGYILLFLPFTLLVVPIVLAGAFTGFAPDAMLGAGLICMLPLMVLIFALFLYLWSYMYFLVDRETGLWAAFRLAFQLGSVNKLNTVILLLLSMGLSTAGMCACFVGQVASVPATVLLAAVAYLQMTGQPIQLPPPPLPPAGAGAVSSEVYS